MSVYWKYTYNIGDWAIWERDNEQRLERYIYVSDDDTPNEVGEWEAFYADTIEKEMSKSSPNIVSIVELTEEEVFLEMI
jgi:hypothetical protein